MNRENTRLAPEKAPKSSNGKSSGANINMRISVLAMMLVLGTTGLLVRALDLQVVRKSFYQEQGDQRFLRERVIPVSRGMITDRNGEPLAISTPVESIWVQPKEVLSHKDRLPELARALAIEPELLEQRLVQRIGKEFVYLRRRLPPDEAGKILGLKIPGVNAQREYRRYYPESEVMAHVLGFTNIDDRGQEGIELAFDEALTGTSGAKRVIQNRRGEEVEDVELLRAPQPGHDLRLSLDRRIQYLAYRELKRTIAEHRASSGSVVILDVPTGEILAMVNWPSYNPNAPSAEPVNARRNRAVTDVFEPGSVIKAFTVAAGIESGKFDKDTLIDTNPGTLQVANHIVRDVHNYGVVDLEKLLMKSSNVAAAKISLQLRNEDLYDMFRRFGFGEATGCGFPGESPGVLPLAQDWSVLEKATLSYGYGLSITPLQLAKAYGALSHQGRLREPTFIRDGSRFDAAVLDPQIADAVVSMLATVTGDQGTGSKAAIPNYEVAGKTGTSRKAIQGAYQSRYVSVFAGLVPVKDPRLVGVVVINDPQGEAYYGGLVAAPVFSQVMGGALRLLDIPPDRIEPADLNSFKARDSVAALLPDSQDVPYAEGVQP